MSVAAAVLLRPAAVPLLVVVTRECCFAETLELLSASAGPAPLLHCLAGTCVVLCWLAFLLLDLLRPDEVSLCFLVLIRPAEGDDFFGPLVSRCWYWTCCFVTCWFVAGKGRGRGEGRGREGKERREGKGGKTNLPLRNPGSAPVPCQVMFYVLRYIILNIFR